LKYFKYDVFIELHSYFAEHCEQVLTDPALHLFSVQTLHRGDRSSVDTYGFVQLPVVQDARGNPVQHVHSTVYALMGQCHVSGCMRRPIGGEHLASAIDDETASLSASVRLDELDCCPHVASAIICDSKGASGGGDATAVMDASMNTGKTVRRW